MLEPEKDTWEPFTVGELLSMGQSQLVAECSCPGEEEGYPNSLYVQGPDSKSEEGSRYQDIAILSVLQELGILGPTLVYWGQDESR